MREDLVLRCASLDTQEMRELDELSHLLSAERFKRFKLPPVMAVDHRFAQLPTSGLTLFSFSDRGGIARRRLMIVKSMMMKGLSKDALLDSHRSHHDCSNSTVLRNNFSDVIMTMIQSI